MAEISVRKRGKYYEYRFGVAPIDGKRKWSQKSGFKTKKEAKNAGAEALAEYINAGAPAKPCNMSYSDYLDYWVDNYCKRELAYNTIATYETLIRLYIKPKIGIYRLADINSVTLTKFTEDLVYEHDFSRDYYKNIIKVVKSSFSYAIEHGLLKYDPSSKTKLPRKNYRSSRKRHVFSQEEIDMVLERFKDNRAFTCAFLTACYTGMRTGEILALTWNDINFDEGFISIKHSVYDKPKDSLGRWYMGETKTKTGTRIIPLGDTLKETLLNYKKYQDLTKELYSDSYKKYGLRDIKVNGDIVTGRIVDREYSAIDLDFVFTRDDGTYSGTDIIKGPNSVMKELLNTNCRFYDLRGTFVTRLAHEDVVLKDIATIVGHASTKVTETNYLSTLNEDTIRAINKMNEMVSSTTISEVTKYST